MSFGDILKHYSKKVFGAIKGGLLYILSGNILIKAISMISSIVIARVVDKTDYAYYSYALNLYSYIGLVAGLGLASALLKYGASEDDPQKNKAYFLFACKTGTIVQFVISVLLCICICFIDIPFNEAKVYVYALLLMPALDYMLSVIQMYLRACQNYKRYALVGLIQALIVCVGGIGLAFCISVWGVIFARYAAVIIVSIIGAYYLLEKIRSQSNVELSRYEKKGFVGMGISLMVADLFSSIMPINENFLVNNIIKDEVVTANFKVAGLLPSQLILITGSIVIYYFPIVAKIDNYNVALRKIIKIALLNLLIVSIVCICGIVFTPSIIKILYGEKYMDAISISNMLWIMRWVNVGFRMVPMNFLPALGKTKFNAVCAAVSCVVQVVLDYYFIMTYGIQGVAYATLVVYLISGLAFWEYLIRVCKKKDSE